MAEDSPCRRTPSTMPSSVHSMGWSLQDSGGSAAISAAFPDAMQTQCGFAEPGVQILSRHVWVPALRYTP